MKVNIENINKLIKENFRNNKTWFAEEIGMNPKYVIQILNGNESDESPKFIKCLLKYCKSKKINYNDYIFLP